MAIAKAARAETLQASWKYVALVKAWSGQQRELPISDQAVWPDGYRERRGVASTATLNTCPRGVAAKASADIRGRKGH